MSERSIDVRDPDPPADGEPRAPRSPYGNLLVPLVVVPFMVVALLTLLHWNDLLAGTALRWKDEPLTAQAQIALLGSFLILAGTPVIEELFRTLRYAREERLVASSQR